MKFYVDEQGNRYRVDRETGERILIEPAEGTTEPGEVSTQTETTDTDDED